MQQSSEELRTREFEDFKRTRTPAKKLSKSKQKIYQSIQECLYGEQDRWKKYEVYLNWRIYEKEDSLQVTLFYERRDWLINENYLEFVENTQNPYSYSF